MDDIERLPPPVPEKKTEPSGSWLWKNLKPFGCILCLVCMAAALIMCFTSGTDPLPGYAPGESREFYMENPEALAAEIEENLVAELEHVLDCYVQEGKVVVVLDEGHFASARSAVLKYFDEENLKFVPKN